MVNKANQSDGVLVPWFVVYATLAQRNPLQHRHCWWRYVSTNREWADDMEIVNFKDRPEYLPVLQHYLNLEWGEGDPFATSPTGIPNPKSLVMISKGKFVGGLSFTWPLPEQVSTPELWINTVYVVKEYRRQCVATKLIQAAVELASDIGQARMFVLIENDVLYLYTKIGWEMHSSGGVFSVLVKKIEINAPNNPAQTTDYSAAD